MKYLNTLPNSFIVGEKDNDGNILEQYGFPKGGLTYLIKGNNIKFYLTEDYFYKNVVFSADAPFLINGIPVSVDNLPAALKNIFRVEQEQVDVDTEFNTESFNPIANAPVAIRFNDVDSTIDSLSGEVQTKADIEDIPTNVSELVNDEGYVTQNDIDAAVSGKVNTTDFNTYSASTDNRLSEDEEVTAAALNALNAVSGDVNTLSGQVATISGDVNTLSGSVESLHGAVSDVVGDVSTLSGKVNTDETILTGHTANTDIHVTASDKQNWNNKSDFSGDYNDLTNKPTIPVVPTNVSDFVNDAGYATSGYVDSSVSGKMDTSAFNTYSASTDARISEDEEVTSAALNALNDALDDKADIEDIPTNVSELVNDAGYATSGYVDSSVSGKMDTSTFNTYSASTDARISEDEEVTAAGLNALNDKFGGMKLVQISESDYEALVTKDPSVLYIIPETN